MKHVDRIAFVKRGSFSHTNASVLEQLRAQFPRFSVDVIDVNDLPLSGPRSLPRLSFAALKHYGAASLRSKSALLRSIMYTPTFFDEARKQLLHRLGRSRYLFTFQTQGVFDASVPGTPHFVYTDHTHLANLEYPSFRRDDLACSEWIARERSVYRQATLTFTMSSNITRSLTTQYGCTPESVECVYVGMNAAPEPEAAARRRLSKTILFVGVVWERKGGPVLAEAFRQVLQVHPTAELIIVGCWPKVELPQCTVVGRVPLREVDGYYRKAAIFCVPTRIEPFGIVFIEALARGIPVVGSRIGALPDFVLEDETGYLVEPDDSDALAARLIDLLGDPVRQERLGQRGQILAASRYTWPHVGTAIRAAIERRLR